jgi:hypothetical protein
VEVGDCLRRRDDDCGLNAGEGGEEIDVFAGDGVEGYGGVREEGGERQCEGVGGC